MSITLDSAFVVTEDWSISRELNNGQTRFETIEELFDLVMQMSDPGDIDRIVLQGKDNDGEDRMMVLSFNYILGK